MPIHDSPSYHGYDAVDEDGELDRQGDKEHRGEGEEHARSDDARLRRGTP